MHRLRRLIGRVWAAAPIATAILGIALMAAGVFGVRSAVHWLDRPPHAERQQLIASWMTPRYVARSWNVPRTVVLDALGVSQPLPDGPTSLSWIADMKGESVEQVIEDLETAIAQFYAEQGRTTAAPTQEAEND